MAISGSKNSTMAASGKNPDIPNLDGTPNQMYSNSEKRLNIIIFGVAEFPWGLRELLDRKVTWIISPWLPVEVTLQLDLTHQ